MPEWVRASCGSRHTRVAGNRHLGGRLNTNHPQANLVAGGATLLCDDRIVDQLPLQEPDAVELPLVSESQQVR